jgi:hypothetical protein
MLDVSQLGMTSGGPSAESQSGVATMFGILCENNNLIKRIH